jgi:hypothetical protein
MKVVLTCGRVASHAIVRRIEGYHGRQKGEKEDVNQLLPLSHTCMFSLELPHYTTLEAITDRITYAMVHCADIDTDSARRSVYRILCSALL